MKGSLHGEEDAIPVPNPKSQFRLNPKVHTPGAFEAVTQHPLQRRLQALRSRVRRLLLVRGTSAIVASVLTTVIALGTIDYAIRFRDRGMLVIFSACVLAVFAWTLHRFLGRLRGIRLGDTELALRIEACFPAVKDRLASAVEFLRQAENDAAAGSAAMRRAAVSQATAKCDEIDFGRVLNLRPAFRAAAACAAVCIVAAGLALLDPAVARTALARLALPLGNTAWPQSTHLQLKSAPQRIARGQALEIEVVDARGAQLPATCRVHYRFRDTQGRLSKKEESEAMHSLGQSMIARRESVARPLEFRVTGGDDQSMPWRLVEVLDPPAVQSLSLDVVPPSYANWPRETRDAASASPILSGSRVELSGEASKPLRSAVLQLDGGREIAARIEGDGRSFRFGGPSAARPDGLVLEKPGGYAIVLVDRDGICGIEKGRQFRVQADAPPSVVIDRPSGNLFVTPTAQVELRMDARDDLALRQVALVYRASGAATAGTTSFSLYEGPRRAPPRGRPAEEAGDGDRRTIDGRWDLKELKLPPGTQLAFYAVATDYRGQSGRSEPRTIAVVTAEELQNRLAQRQGRIAAELARLLQLQRNAHDDVRALEVRLQDSGSLQKTDVDLLQLAELSQRETAHGLADRREGVSALAQGVLDDLETNRIENPQCARRMQGLLDEFTRLQREHLAPIGDALTLAVKGAQIRLQSSPPPAGRDAEDEALLTRAGEHQQHVIDALEDALAQLRQWDDYRRFRQDVAQLILDQREVARAAAELGLRTLGRDLKEQETADLAALVERQSELARRQNRIEQEMEQAIGLLRPNEPLAADTLSDAVAEARRLAIAVAMQDVAGKIGENDLGQAPAAHQRILQDLQAVLDILADNRAQESQRLATELGASARDLDGLRKRQEELRRKLDALAVAIGKGQANAKQMAELRDLVRQQKEVRQDTPQLSRRLERLLAKEAADSANEAAEKMRLAETAGEGGSATTADRRATDAEHRLADAADQLQQKQAELSVQQALQQQARLEDAIRRLHRQESQIQRDTTEYAALERSGPLSREQVFGLLELARQQSLRGDEADRLSATLDAANVFRLAVSAATEEMRRAAAFLQEQRVDPTTQQAEQAAIDRLALLLAAMEPEKLDSPPPDDHSHIAESTSTARGKSGNSSADAPAGGMIMLAEVRLLKLWQEDMNRRTQQLDLDAAGKPPEARREHYDHLANEQARLAAATVQLLKPIKADADAGERKQLGTAAQQEDQPQQPLVDAAKGMREVQMRLAQGKSDAITQLVQRQIVADLQKIIDEAKKSGKCLGQDCTRDDCRSPRKGGAGQSAQDEPPPRTTTGPARESNPNARHSPPQPGSREQQRAAELMRQYNLRLQARRPDLKYELPSDHFLPEYEGEIEDYFRRLSSGTAASER